MTMPNAADFKLYLVRGFFDAPGCAKIVAELARAPGDRAPVYGGRGGAGAVDERVRRVTRLAPSSETVEYVRLKLLGAIEAVSAHFGPCLTGCEDPQFLRYRVGDFFVAHQDGNTGMLLSEQERSRKVSVVIFLNRQADSPTAGSYGGGSLVFSEWRPGRRQGRYELAGEAGMLVAFPSETTHEVIPVVWGERYSIVSWYR
ncbi:MAG: 2OG-Fe(II) oxygenase [Pyrinomonadaceae bacterium]